MPLARVCVRFMAIVMTGWERIGLGAVAAMLLAMLAGLAAGQGAARPAPGPAAAATPRRIVSLNLCTDQLLLAVADRGQIAAVTRFATQPAMSAEADAARGLPVIGQGAEALAAIDPDMVMGMPATGSPMLTAIAGKRYRTLDLGWAANLADIRTQLRAVAQAAGQPRRAEAKLAAMDAILDHVGRPGRGRVAAYYQRRGPTSSLWRRRRRASPIRAPRCCTTPRCAPFRASMCRKPGRYAAAPPMRAPSRALRGRSRR